VNRSVRASVVSVAAALLIGGCGGAIPTGGSPSTAASPAKPPVSADSVLALPQPSDNVGVLGGLLGVPTAPLDGENAGMRDAIAKQLGTAVDGPVPLPPNAVPAAFHAANSDAMVLGFLVIDMTIMSRALPSKLAADTLSGMVKEVGGGPGRDGPDKTPREEQTKTTPFNATSGTSTGTGSMETKVAVQAEHSLVTVDLDRTLALNFTKEGESGTVVVGIHNTESVDFCPDAGGIVPVKVHSVFTMTTAASTVTATIDGTFEGHVDAQAGLASISGNATVTGGTQSGGSTSSDYDASLSGVALGASGTVEGGTWQGHGDQALQGVGAALADLQHSIPEIFSGASRMWEKSACVSVQVPDFGAYASPLDAADASHDKEVDPASKTQFTVQVHHRFLHTELNIPVKLTLESAKKIDPTTVSSTPGGATYEAPSKPGEANLVRLESKSVRGATRFAINFHTRDLKPTMSLTGHMVEVINAAARTTFTLDMRMTKVAFAPTGGGTEDQPRYSATAKVSGSITVVFAGVKLPCRVFATESGTIPLVATLLEKDDGSSVWRIKADQNGTNLNFHVTCASVAASRFGANSGEIRKFFAALGEFEIPTEPGTYPVSGSADIPIGHDTATGKVTVYDPNK
jgi:hypothetical protein